MDTSLFGPRQPTLTASFPGSCELSVLASDLGAPGVVFAEDVGEHFEDPVAAAERRERNPDGDRGAASERDLVG
jgi:hypothetical protein